MALTFAAPPEWERPVAAAAVIALAAVNYRGVTRTARLARWIVGLVLLALAITVTVALGGGDPDWAQVSPADGGAQLLGGPAGWYGVLQAGAAAASLGALLALVAGIGRTSLAMARERDLPGWLAAVHPRFRVPHRAEVALAIVLVVLVLAVDLRGAIGFSSFGVPVYYAVANLSAWTQTGAHRRFPRILQAVGLAGCLALCATLPWTAVLAGVTVFAVGLGVRALRVR